MTTPWRSVQDAEKANETVAWQALPCRLSGGRVRGIDRNYPPEGRKWNIWSVSSCLWLWLVWR